MSSITLRYSSTAVIDAPSLGAKQAARTTQVLRRDLRASLGDGIGWGGMVGFGETYLPAFALAIGLGELTAGLVASLPMLAGGIMQTVTPTAIRLLKSHKRWVLCGATIQGMAFVPLLFAALRGWITAPGLLLVVAVYWGAGLATGPAWNTWMGTLVPAGLRPGYFALRTRVSQAAVFGGFFGGGLLLQYSAAHDWLLYAFSTIFAIAWLSRMASVTMLSLQSEPQPIPANMRNLPWRERWQHLRGHSGGQLLVYLVTVQAAVQLSGPYFTPFMFKKLEFSYAAYVTLISIAYLAKVLALPLCGRIARRVGTWRLLWFGAVGIIPLSGGWILSQNYTWLLMLQIWGGVAWGAYELAFFLLFFESIKENERTSMLTLYNLLNTTAWVSGALFGGLLLTTLGTSFEAYLLLFGISSLGRLAALPLLARIAPHEAVSDQISLRPVAVRPNAASLDAPILPSLRDQAREETTLQTVESLVVGVTAHPIRRAAQRSGIEHEYE